MADTNLAEELHADAGLALLRADTSLVVYAGSVPNPAPNPPYVLVYVDVAWPDGDPGNGADGTSGTCVTRWYCHAIGGNLQAARAVATRVRTALLDKRPTITGRACGLIRQEATQPPQRDESTGALVMDQVAVYRLATRPA